MDLSDAQNPVQTFRVHNISDSVGEFGAPIGRVASYSYFTWHRNFSVSFMRFSSHIPHKTSSYHLTECDGFGVHK